jgi:SpoVK/Ycf46/Vps4 family AAA+-type ATPase
MAKKKKSKVSQSTTTTSTPKKTPPKQGQQHQEDSTETHPKYTAIALRLPSESSVKKTHKTIEVENDKVVCIHESDARGFSVKQGEEVLVVQIDVKNEDVNTNTARGTLLSTSTQSNINRGSWNWSPQNASVSWRAARRDQDFVSHVHIHVPRLVSICRVKIMSGSGHTKFISPRSQSGGNAKTNNLPVEGEARLSPMHLIDCDDTRSQDRDQFFETPDTSGEDNLESLGTVAVAVASSPIPAKSQFTFESFVISPAKKGTPAKETSPQKKKNKRYIALLSLHRSREAYKALTGDAKSIELSLYDSESSFFAINVLKKAEKVLGRMVQALCHGKYFSIGETITISFQGKKLQFIIEKIEWDGEQVARIPAIADDITTSMDHTTEQLARIPVIDDDITTSMENMTIDENEMGDSDDVDALAKDINAQLTKAVSSPILARVDYQTLFKFCLEGEVDTSSKDVGDNEEKDAVKQMKVVAGLDDVRDKIQTLLIPTLFHPERFPRSGPIRAPKGVLLHGSSGCGKSLLAEQIASDIKHYDFNVTGTTQVRVVETVHVNCASVQSSTSIMGEGEKKVTTIFKRAERRAVNENVSTLLIFDDIHLICPRRGAAGEGTGVERVASTLLALMDGIGNSSQGQNDQCGNIAILAITSNPSSLDPALRRAGRLDTEVEVPSPDDKAKGEILALCLENLKAANVIVPSLSETDLRTFSRMAKGFTGADCTLGIKEAVRTAISRHRANNDLGMELTIADIQKGIRMTKPSAIKAVTVEIPRVPWSSIGGMEDVKRSLREAIELPLTHSHLFAALRIPPPRGVLLYGPPGCSKTLMARALATEGNMNFLAVKGPELLSKWLGESERALAALFRRARLASPCVIFFDEIDAIASKRGSGESSGGERMLSQLLTELDGVNSTSSKDEKQPRVVVVGATNRPDLLDNALTRPGRIDRMIHVGVPDEETRKAIFQLQMKDKACDPDLDVSKTVKSKYLYASDIFTFLSFLLLNLRYPSSA